MTPPTQREWSAVTPTDLTTLTVTTHHPTDYVLLNEEDGTRWRGTEDGRWQPAVTPTREGLRAALLDLVALLPPDRWDLLREETKSTVDDITAKSMDQA